ncbi:MAG TPA: LLM class F420-dependent oxidoreductase [Candidatus Binatia bacterium]|nr:LLM class F420-dependent oxidoreductase [Candidatus Binatia bacterium]
MKRHPLRFGVQAAPQQVSWAELREVWQEVEDLGFDTLWVNDHLLPSVGPADAPNLEGWTMLGAMAALTSRVRLGVMVTSNTFRHPVVLAKMATTVDHLSKGRLILGIGSGYFEQEHQVYGIPLPTARHRARQLEEALEVIRKLWTEEQVSFTGTYYRLTNAPFAPKPVQKPHPPIMIGGSGEQLTLPLVAKYADMWNAGALPLPVLTRKIAVLAEHCRQIGRDGGEIEKTYLTPLYLRENPADVEQLLQQVPQVQTRSVDQIRALILAGDVASVQRQVQAYVDVGVTHLILALRRPGFFDREGLRLFAQAIMPHFRTAA